MLEALAPAVHTGALFTDTTVPPLQSLCHKLCHLPPTATHTHTRARLAGRSGRSEAGAFSHLHNEAFVGVAAAPPQHPQRQQRGPSLQSGPTQ